MANASLTDDNYTFLGLLYQLEIERRSANADIEMCASSRAAEQLGWSPAKLNEVVTALSELNTIAIDARLSPPPYSTRGFTITDHGFDLYTHWEGRQRVAGQRQDNRMNEGQAVRKPDPKKVFIVHGRNIAARNAIEQFVRVLGLEPLDFDRVSSDLGGTPFIGDIVRDGLERAHGIIALFTPDEFSALRSDFRRVTDGGDEVQRWQARPNVIFEAGMAYGLAPRRTVLVTLGTEVSLFSDVGGIHIVRLDNSIECRKLLRQKLIGVGCELDLVADSWTDCNRSGEFEACALPLSGVSPSDPFGHDAVGKDDPMSANSQVQLTLDYKLASCTPSQYPTRHDYRLLVTLENVDKKRIDDWEIEVEFPTPLLNEPGDALIVVNRSNANRSLFRILTGQDGQGPLRPGDKKQATINYHMDNDIYDNRQELLDEFVVVRALINGELVHQIRKRVRGELENF